MIRVPGGACAGNAGFLAAAWLGGSGCSPVPSRHVPSSKPLVEMAVSSGFSRVCGGRNGRDDLILLALESTANLGRLGSAVRVSLQNLTGKRA